MYKDDDKEEDEDDTVVGPLNLGAFIGICVGGVVVASLAVVCLVLRRRGRKMASTEAEYCKSLYPRRCCALTPAVR